MIKNHFKIAWRNIKKKKGFALINILGLSLGFASSILIFLFVSHHLQFDKFHSNADRIYRFVTEQHKDYINYVQSVPPGFTNAFRNDYEYAEKVAKIVNWEDEVIYIEESNLKIKAKKGVVFAEPEFFEIFDFPLIDGSKNIQIKEPNTAIVTETMANRLFGEENPINKTFLLANQEIVTVTGILKDLPKNTLVQGDIFVSFQTLKKINEGMGGETWSWISPNLQCFALLYPGQNITQIESALTEYQTKFRPNSKNIHHYKLQSIGDVHFDSRYDGGLDVKLLWIFSLVGFFIMVVAGINFVNISTAQSVSRSKEVGVRKVLGSFISQLFWQFMTETFLIVFLALILGLLVGIASLPYFNSIFDLQLSISNLFTGSFFVFVSILLLGITLFVGSYPGILLARISPVLAFKRKLSQNDSGGSITRQVLVTTQFIVSIVLIVETIVVNKQIKFAIDSDLGFNKSAIVMVEIPEEVDAVQLNGLKERIEQHQGIEKVSACYAAPGAGKNEWSTNVRYNRKSEDEVFSVQVKIADKEYLNTFGLQLLAGRNFYEKDSVDEILINETFAKKLGVQSLDEVLGKQLTVADDYVKGNVVGVIKDFHDQDFHKNISPVFIAPATDSYTKLAVKINLNDSQAALAHLEKHWNGLFSGYIFEHEFLDDRVAQLYATEQRFLELTKLFSGIAIFIGSMGIYGLILFLVVQKTKEIGIRKVLGSSLQGILWLIVKDFLKLILIAGLIASPLAWYFMGNWLENFNYRTDLSWWIFLLAIGCLVAITLTTVSFQAIKAARSNPIKSLRTE